MTEMGCGTEAGSYLRRIDSCVTRLKAQGPSRTCNESKEEEGETVIASIARFRPSARFDATCVWGVGFGVWGLGFGVWGMGFRVWGLGSRV